MSVSSGSAADVSYEIGACYVPVDGGLPGLSDADKQVFACLTDHRPYIADAELDFSVSRIAIAGAIAWEMLENVRTWSPRSTGFGKVHLFNYRVALIPIHTNTAAEQVEQAGYLPKRTYGQRKLLLAMPPSAIRYIAALMAAISDLAGRYGFADIRDDPEILTNVYQSMDLKEWEAHLKAKKPGTAFAGGNRMDIWVKAHLTFLTAAVGPSHVPPKPATAPGVSKTVAVFRSLTTHDDGSSPPSMKALAARRWGRHTGQARSQYE